jgi:quercetin dioxygenase-like cupin family protein
MEKVTTQQEFTDPKTTRKWHQVAELPQGVTETILYRDEKTGTYSRLLRYEPGYPGTDEPMCHDFDEVVYIAEGTAANKRLGITYTAGSVAVFPAGLKHGPLASPTGGLLVEFRYYKK